MSQITYHRDDAGAREVLLDRWNRMQLAVSVEDRYRMANHVAHGARATLTDKGVLLERRDWPESILLDALPSTSEAAAIPQASTWENSQNPQKGKS